MQTIAFIMGPTCSGKSTLLKFAEAYEPKLIGLVEVGKILRAKYPPDYFKGQDAPKHTQEEAWELCEKTVFEHLNANKKLVLVDGQPRCLDQVHKCVTRFAGLPCSYILLTADLEVRRERAKIKYRDDPGSLDLAMQRATNDMLSNYTVIAELLRLGVTISVVDTTKHLDAAGLVKTLLEATE